MLGIRTTTGRLDDGLFRRSLAALWRRAAERSAQRSAVDPDMAAQARHAALLACDRARTRRLTWLLSLAAGAIGGTAIAALVAAISASPPPTSASVAAPSVAVAQEPPSRSLEASAVEPAPAPAAVVSEAQPPPAETAPSASAPNDPPLQSDEVREVQTRLRSFGFNPGPVDGVAGRMTEGAVLRYQQQRAQQRTGAVDRQLLEQLRQDPAPKAQVPRQVARRPTRPDPRPTPAPAARRADPMQPLKDGLDGLGRWIDSLLR